MTKVILLSFLLLSGCATYQPRAGYEAVTIDYPATDNVIIQNPDIIDGRLVLALRDNVQDETASRIRKAGNLEIISQCRDKALELKGRIASVSVKVEEKSSGILNREHKEIKDYRVVMRGSLVDCRTGKIIDDISLEENAGDIQKIATHLSKELARFVEFKSQ